MVFITESCDRAIMLRQPKLSLTCEAFFDQRSLGEVGSEAGSVGWQSCNYVSYRHTVTPSHHQTHSLIFGLWSWVFYHLSFIQTHQQAYLRLCPRCPDEEICSYFSFLFTSVFLPTVYAYAEAGTK